MEILALYSPNLLTFFSMFLFIYLFGYLLLFRSWSPKHRLEASSCFLSLAHGTPAVLMATNAIINAQTPRTFASSNTNLQNTVLEYGISYFLVDLLHYLVFFPHDILFILHHVATLYVFVTCRYIVHHGAFALLILLILAEVTSACQNVWSISGVRRADVAAARKLYESLSPAFYAFYSVARGILGPVVVYEMGMFYFSAAADNLIPRWAWMSWLVVIGTAIFVSLLWVVNNWVEWFRERNHNALNKER